MKINLINENFREHYLANLLATRGVHDIKEFINPSIFHLSDPYLFSNSGRGCYLLDDILAKSDSSILVIVDSDVDGFTSGAIIWNYIRAIAPNQKMEYRLHEHKQHGLQDHINYLMDLDTVYDLIILPDSSTNDYEYHEALGARGTKFLVLDHHDLEPDKPISKYACIINNQTSDTYPNKDLTGAGVTWQFCRAHESRTDPYIPISSKLMDLAALGICGDMGSVLSLENRYIMKQGFSHITNYFFQCAIEKQSFSMGSVVNPTTVAFYIVPMMNAMIRVGTQDEKNRLFQAIIDGHAQIPCNKRGAKGTTEEAAIESLRECTNAKAKQTRITDQMVGKLEQKIFKYDLLENKILFIRLDEDDDFPAEINGLIAMKLAARFKRPAIVTRLNDEGYDRGSIRNVADCELADLKAFLNESGYFEYVQGHPNAAGCSILDSNLRAFHEYANAALSHIDFNEGAYDVNFERTANDKDLEDLVFEIGSYPELWGQGNPEPLIYVHDLYISPNEIQVMGAKKDTLKIEKNGVAFMKFHATDMIDQLSKCNEIKMNVVGRANINTWMGNETAQIFIENWEVIDNLLEF